MSEVLRSNEKLEQKPALDEHLFDNFAEVAAFQAYEYLDGDKKYRSEQKNQFLSGEINNPTLDYPSLDIDRINQIESSLLAMKREIITGEQNEIVKQTYRWRLNEKIAEARMLKAAVSGDSDRFTRYSEFIYGKPSPDVFNYTVNTIRMSAERNLSSDNVDVQIAATELLESLPIVEVPRFTNLPDAETVDFARNQTITELGDLINMPADVKKLDATQIKDVFDYAINKVGADDWSVVIDEKSSKTAISVSQETAEVKIPAERSATRSKVEGLILHEIGTHVARRVNGEHSKLKLLGLGLDRYEAGDEGVATMREQALAGKVDDFRGVEKLLGIGLALGTDGQPRDFREVYNILEKYLMFNNLVSGKELIDAHEKSQTSAWNNTVRIFRGTNCKTPGACFTKDIVYRNGSIGVWDVIKNNPSEMSRFNVGKYDPSNHRHIFILEQLGITDSDLSELEQ